MGAAQKVVVIFNFPQRSNHRAGDVEEEVESDRVLNEVGKQAGST